MEKPEDLFRRVSKAVAEAELNYPAKKQNHYWQEAFFEAMMNLDFMPNSPTLMNAGCDKGQLSACFVLPIEDKLTSTIDTLKLASIIQQSGGGTGFNFSKICPHEEPIFTTHGETPGPVSFIKIFDEASERIRQSGKRRAANMAILNIDHPDIEAFISAKSEEGTLQNFNLSVGISDTFVRALKEGADWHLVNPRTQEVTKTISARALQELMVHYAWKTGDPGIIFLDRIERFNPTPALGRFEATNPCGEMPLLPFEACNLGSVNLSRMIHKANGKPSVDWDKLERMVILGVRFLDDVIDVNHYPLPEIDVVTRGNRKIGLGVMGWAEMLIQLGISYVSRKAYLLAEEVMSFIYKKSLMTSILLAEERGSFPNWKQSVYYNSTPIRNATRTSIAPTGSISIIANTSSSIEPLFALSFTRKHTLGGKDLTEYNQYFIEALKSHHLDRLMVLEEVRSSGSLRNLKGLPTEFKNLFLTSLDIPYNQHIRHQAAFQKYTDNAVSKTINLPNDASEDIVKKVADLAWASGIKGVTVYRDGCRNAQVLHQGIYKSASCKVCFNH